MVKELPDILSPLRMFVITESKFLYTIGLYYRQNSTFRDQTFWVYFSNFFIVRSENCVHEVLNCSKWRIYYSLNLRFKSDQLTYVLYATGSIILVSLRSLSRNFRDLYFLFLFVRPKELIVEFKIQSTGHISSQWPNDNLSSESTYFIPLRGPTIKSFSLNASSVKSTP